ncbi:uroporphyrinogen-III synthase [Virgibacillus halodenitrificans]|uniref:uroporphyrinogen-III synthase n=1 Tax=Virgibacillus halodenitrificans TaxID=1482 RepID=UPI000EF5351B|nr:uroporphyrinogen-III synthase [Virgibacillus halodenitrificans]
MNVSLQGKQILVTREKKQAKEFADLILEHQGIPIEVPLLTVSCKDHKENQEVLQSISNYDWIFFTSANGVKCFFEMVEKYLTPENALPTNIAVVGHKTENALKRFGYSATFRPSVYNAEVMGMEFLTEFPNPGSILLVRGNLSRDVLPTTFIDNGLNFDSIEVYETSYNFLVKEQLNKHLEKSQIDFITFTSPSTVESFCAMAAKKTGFVYVCIGTTTENKAREIGLSPIISPSEFTIEEMVRSISKYISMKG